MLDKEYFTEREVVHIMKQLLNVLEYLHAKNIVHRDLKLENILVRETEEGYKVILIDFGQAKEIKDSKPMTKVCGSLFYLPPEVMKRSYNQKCDLWSLGVICYSLLTGHFPFDSEEDDEIYEKIAFQKVTFNKLD